MAEREPLLRSQTEPTVDIHSNGKDYIVDFDPEGDEENPRTWSKKYRWFLIFLLSFIALNITFTCIGIVPVAGRIIQDLEGEKDKSASVLLVTIWELGEAAGPLFIAPLSEIFGRRPVYNVANFLFLSAVLISALSQSARLLIFSRFLTGCAVASNVLNPAIVGDMFPSDLRGSPMSMVMLAPLIGGAIGPSVAGSLAEATGWREILWLALGLFGACQLAFVVFFQETYKVKIIRRRAARLRKETGDQRYRTDFDSDMSRPLVTVAKTMVRPIKVIWSSSLLQALALWGAWVFSFFYVFSTSLPDMLSDVYGFAPAAVGLAFLSFSVGSFIGIGLNNFFSDRVYVKLQQKGGEYYHEGRLPLSIAAGFLLPFVVLLYGWAVEPPWPAWVLLVSVGFIGMTVVLGCVPMMTYVTDSFGLYSASALTTVLILRCLAGSFVPLLVPPLTDHLGYGWTFTILAAVCLVLSPVPAVAMRVGPVWRQRSIYSRTE